MAINGQQSAWLQSVFQSKGLAGAAMGAGEGLSECTHEAGDEAGVQVFERGAYAACSVFGAPVLPQSGGTLPRLIAAEPSGGAPPGIGRGSVSPMGQTMPGPVCVTPLLNNSAVAFKGPPEPLGAVAETGPARTRRRGLGSGCREQSRRRRRPERRILTWTGAMTDARYKPDDDWTSNELASLAFRSGSKLRRTMKCP